MSDPSADSVPTAPSDFIRDIVARDVQAQRYPGIVTRFPPEPNGYLHIGHAKSICLNFGLAREYGGRCNLRMDDTNPTKEDVEYVESITHDVHWLLDGWADQTLGFKAQGQTLARAERDAYQAPATADGNTAREPFFASDYFEALHDFAVELIRRGAAYVCDLTPAQTEAYRGGPDTPGRNSPFRDRSIDENLELFAGMRAGKYPDGARTLRAKIDMGSPNMWLRDPLLYRIRHVSHHHAGDGWCIYPLYDYAHCLSDYIEGITHSVCTLEFEVHRPLYDWILAQLDLPRPVPHQYEFARLSVGYMITSKRKLLQLVNEKHVDGWDDPRMPTISGIRRRGVPAAAVRNFCIGVGVTKFKSLTDIAVLEHAIREELNATAQRRLGVLRPLKVVITNIAPGEVLITEAANHPKDDTAGNRPVRLTREVYIEAEDFAELPPPKFFRLKPGGAVRLKYGCIVDFAAVVKDANGDVTEVHVMADLESRSGGANADRKVKGTIHWVSANEAIDAEVRLYDRLFTVAEPDKDDDFLKHLNPASLETVMAKVEPTLATAAAGSVFQFERLGYFAIDPKDSSPGSPVFNRTITLRDTWK